MTGFTSLTDSSGTRPIDTANPLPVTSGSGATAGQVQGNVASGAADSGNPVKVGMRYNTTLPVPSDGQRVDLQSDATGHVRARMCVAGSTFTDAATWANYGAVTVTNAQTSNALLVNAGVVYNGSTWDRPRGDSTGAVSTPHALPSNRWGYAAASGGILNTTTAVTLVAAGGASVRNYITGLQIDTEALGAATEIAIRDGAGGTVLWRSKIGTAGWVGGRSVTFAVPLRGSVNTLLEVVTLTASVTGAVYVNAQGFQGI